MDEIAPAMILALVLTLALPVACIIFPSLLPHARFNEEGHRYGVDIQMFKMGAMIGALMMIASAFKQGDTQFGVILMAIGVGVVLGTLMGLWAHLVWRRQQQRARRLRHHLPQ